MDKPPKPNLKAAYAVIAAAVLLFASYHGFNSYIDSRISAKTADPDFLKALAKKVRPSLIFNEKGSITADMGASSLIEQITVSSETIMVPSKHGGPGAPRLEYKIIIPPREYLGVEPTLEALDFGYSIAVERGEKFNWVYRLYRISYLICAESPPKPDIYERFRLEIIK